MELKLIYKLVLINFLGIRVVINIIKTSKGLKQIVYTGFGVIFSIVIASLFNYFLKSHYHYELRFIAIPMITVFSGVITAKIFCRVSNYVAVFYYNTAVCGIILLLEGYMGGLTENLLISFMAGAGFLFLLIIAFVIYEKMEQKNLPAALRGEPAILFIVGIISLIVSGLI